MNKIEQASVLRAQARNDQAMRGAATYVCLPHEVTAKRIEKVAPTYFDNTGRITSFEAGTMGDASCISLTLEDGTAFVTGADSDSFMPSIGDFLVCDAALEVYAVVPAEKFKILFQRQD
jgi:hypothetical protein